MKKLSILFLMILAPISTYSFADWRSIGKDEKLEIFLDKESIKVRNESVFSWVMFNEFIPNELGDFSNKQLLEIKCVIPRKSRRLSLTTYTQQMANGSYRWTSNEVQDWVYSSPGSVGAYVVETVCSVVGQ